MIDLCLTDESEFGVIWLSDEDLKEIGCAARVTEVLERLEDGRMNVLVQGSRPFRLLERQEDHVFPAGMVELRASQRSSSA
jgi:Lon protease-like protein